MLLSLQKQLELGLEFVFHLHRSAGNLDWVNTETGLLEPASSGRSIGSVGASRESRRNEHRQSCAANRQVAVDVQLVTSSSAFNTRGLECHLRILGNAKNLSFHGPLNLSAILIAFFRIHDTKVSGRKSQFY